jgi:formiminoglutamase
MKLQGLLFVIGGSNDQSYQNVRALMELHPKSTIGVINIDAHFDVRPLK